MFYLLLYFPSFVICFEILIPCTAGSFLLHDIVKSHVSLNQQALFYFTTTLTFVFWSNLMWWRGWGGDIWSLILAVICKGIDVSPEGRAFASCFILAYSGPCVILLQAVYPGIYRGHCSRFLTQLQSWCILRFVF